MAKKKRNFNILILIIMILAVLIISLAYIGFYNSKNPVNLSGSDYCAYGTAKCSASALLSPNSIFLTPIPSNPSVYSDSNGIINYYNSLYMEKFGKNVFLRANTYDYSYPIYEIKNDMVEGRDYNIQNTLPCTGYNKCYIEGQSSGDIINIPIPINAQADPGTDKHLVIIDWKSNKIYELYNAVKSTSWSASHGSVINIGSLGTKEKEPYVYCSRASCIPIIATTIRKDELLAGNIQHAIAIGVPESRCDALSVSECSSNKVIWYPAGNSDGITLNKYTLPEGARLQLNPAFNVDAQNWKPEIKTIAKAMQTYGIFVTDKAGAITIYFENLKISEGKDWNEILGYDIRSEVGVIPWNEMIVLNEQTPVQPPQPPQPSTSVCGNGIKEAGEECDDGNSNNTDACSSSCKICKAWFKLLKYQKCKRY